MWVNQGHSLRRDEGMFFDGVQHIAELDLGGEGVTVVDDRHPIRTVPAVHCKKKPKKKNTCYNHQPETQKHSHATNHKTTDVATLVKSPLFIYSECVCVYTALQ